MNIIINTHISLSVVSSSDFMQSINIQSQNRKKNIIKGNIKIASPSVKIGAKVNSNMSKTSVLYQNGMFDATSLQSGF